MQQLLLDKQTARKLYRSAAPEFKTMLEETFGIAHFSEKITDRVKTFEDACEVLDISSAGIQTYFPTTLDTDVASIIAYQKLIIIARALNEGWKPDWNNSSENKYNPWFDMRNGFSCDGSDYWRALSDAGSRLCFKTRELAVYAGQQFTDLYKAYFTLQ